MPLASTCICGNANDKFMYMRQCRWGFFTFSHPIFGSFAPIVPRCCNADPDSGGALHLLSPYKLSYAIGNFYVKFWSSRSKEVLDASGSSMNLIHTANISLPTANISLPTTGHGTRVTRSFRIGRMTYGIATPTTFSVRHHFN